jgi:UbiD family decarboxylase
MVESIDTDSVGGTETYGDLREFIAHAERMGEVLHVDGASWDLEMGALAEIVAHKRDEAPAILFDDIPGYPRGYRVLSGGFNSSKRLALTLGFPEPKHPLDLVKAYRNRMKTHEPIPPRVVSHGPVLENIDRDADVDLLKFPVPRLHEDDGGRYIGTNDVVIMRDPDDGSINASTYRVMVHDKNSTGLWISPGKDGRAIREKYFAMGKPCPVVISCGHDPLLFLIGCHHVKRGLSELDYAGGHRGAPIDVVLSEIHGLPMPAASELVIEGEMYPDERKTEGPFGEFTGYYASDVNEKPVVRVRRVYYRNNPIITIATPMRPPSDYMFGKCVVDAGMIWDEVEAAGLVGVTGVWCHEVGTSKMFNVISIKQGHAGHAKQAAMLAASCSSGAYLGRFVIVVDDDVDPSDLFDVMWAVSTRCDPIEDIDFIRNMWSTPLDPMIPHGSKSYSNSRAIVDACRPFARLADFPKVARATPELIAKVQAKFADLLATV